LWFLAAVALSGSVVRLARNRPIVPAADPGLERQLARVESVRNRLGPGARNASAVQRRLPKAPNPARRTQDPVLVDLNQADAVALEDLPGIGPALAARIVAARDSLGGFRALDALCEVRGVGSALIQRVVPFVTLSGVRPAPNAQCPRSPRGARKVHSTKRPGLR